MDFNPCVFGRCMLNPNSLPSLHPSIHVFVESYIYNATITLLHVLYILSRSTEEGT